MADERDLTEHTIESKTAYLGRLLHVREDRVRLPDGSESRREYLVHPGAAVMLAMPDAASVLMERQYRYALRQHVYELPAGKKSFPYHWHIANEEGIYMLEGECTLRLAGKEIPLRAGHYVALPIGEEGAHQLINNSGATCRYLCFSTLQDPEVVIYPDSGKIAFSHRGKEQTDRTKWQMRKILAGAPELDYFQGEE